MKKTTIQIIAIILLVGMILALLPVLASAANTDATDAATPSTPSEPSEPSESSEPSSEPSQPSTSNDFETAPGAIADTNSGVVMIYPPEKEEYMRALDLKVRTPGSDVEALVGNLLAKQFSNFLLVNIFDVNLYQADGTVATLDEAVGLDFPLDLENYVEDPQIFYVDLEKNTVTNLNATLNDDVISLHVITDSLGYFALVGGIKTASPLADVPLWWIVPVVIVLLCGAGIGAYLIISQKQPKKISAKKNKKSKK